MALIDASRLRESSFIRESLEAAGIRLAAKNFGEHDGVVLNNLVGRQEAEIEKGDIAANITVDVEFHRAILTIAGLEITATLLDQIMGDVIRVRHLSGGMPGRLQTTIAEHRSIVAALRSRDPDACELALRDHLQASFRSVVAMLDQHPEYTVAGHM